MDQKTYKQKLLETLYQPYKKCQICPLGFLGRTHVVFGEGNPDAKILFIGEGPGKDEDEYGRPFIGKSGQLLTRALELAAIERQEVFITNIVKCRPPENRKPTHEESTICKNILLLNQIKIIRPEIICTLGSVALQELLNQEVKISQIRGKFLTHNSMLILPTYHPAYVLRNRAELENFILDIKKIKEIKKNQK